MNELSLHLIRNVESNLKKKENCNKERKLYRLNSLQTFIKQINGPDSRKSRKEIVQRLKDATLTDYDKKYSVLVRFCGQHHDHVIGEVKYDDSCFTILYN